MGGIAAKLASKSAEFQNLFLGQFPEQQLKVGNSKKNIMKPSRILILFL